MHLKHLSDQTLLKDTKLLTQQEREVTLCILYHLQEIERRKLYSDLKYPSLFEYAMGELGYGPMSAMRRIDASRLLKELPEIAPAIAEGSLSLSNIGSANKFFRSEKIRNSQQKKQILSQLKGKSARICDKILFDLSKKEVPRKDSLKQVASESYDLSLTINKRLKEKMEKLRALKAHKNFSTEELMEYAYDCAIEKEEAKLSVKKEVKVKVKHIRFIPKSVKVQVMKRDGHACVNCGSKYKLQIDHIKPFAMGGKNNAENLQVLCAPCNQRRAITVGLVNYNLPFLGESPS